MPNINFHCKFLLQNASGIARKKDILPRKKYMKTHEYAAWQGKKIITNLHITEEKLFFLGGSSSHQLFS
jgi:hypothetical protein